jgi:SNF2 family DNA or RNA helicase
MIASPLFRHQRDAVAFAISKNGNCALFHEMGLGKTRTAIEIYRMLALKNPELKLIVFAPLSLLQAAWGADIRKFSGLKFCDCHEKGIPSVLSESVLLLNYEMAIQEKSLKPLLELFSKYQFAAVCDESSRMKNSKAKTTKTLLKFAEKLKHRIVMSGTPAPNGLYEYWAQMQFVHPSIFHPSFYAFRNTYFHLERNGYKMIQQGSFMTRQMAKEIFSKGFKYEITPANEKRLVARMEPWAHQAKKINCLDLPEQIDEVREVEMGPKQKVLYKEMKRNLITTIQGETVTAQVALAKLMKLREMTSGFAIDERGETRDIGENPKIAELESILEEAGNQPVIIWCQFQKEIRDVSALLTKLGKTFSTIYAETDDRNESIQNFLNGKSQYLIAHPRSAAHGLTFVNCSLQVFYSLSYSWEEYEQARARTHRAGQRNACTYIHILAKDSIDQEIYKVLQKKQSIQEVVCAFLEHEPKRVA